MHVKQACISDHQDNQCLQLAFSDRTVDQYFLQMWSVRTRCISSNPPDFLMAQGAAIMRFNYEVIANYGPGMCSNALVTHSSSQTQAAVDDTSSSLDFLNLFFCERCVRSYSFQRPFSAQDQTFALRHTSLCSCMNRSRK